MTNRSAHRTAFLDAQRITPDDAHYFFAYFDKCPWSPDGRYILTHRAGFQDRQPTAEETAQVGVIDLKDGDRYRRLGETHAWCWQLGSQTGKVCLLVSLDRLARFEPRVEGMATVQHGVNHLVISPDSRRLMFLHRWQKPPGPWGRWGTRLFTIGADGDDLYLLNDNDMTSHMTWFAPDRIVAYANREHPGYYEFTDRTPHVKEIGAGQFSGDGHCSYSPDGHWMLTDTYPDPETHERTLILYRLRDGTRFDLGKFYHDPRITGPFRCDLHPRWNRAGDRICFDSIHEGFRGVYVMDLRDFLPVASHRTRNVGMLE